MLKLWYEGLWRIFKKDIDESGFCYLVMLEVRGIFYFNGGGVWIRVKDIVVKLFVVEMFFC